MIYIGAMRFISHFFAVAGLVMAAGQAADQANQPFPTKVVTLVVPFTANSGSDIIARVLGPKLSKRWGQPVVVVNRPGASGILGANTVAKAAPDGHTLLMAINTFTMAPALYKQMPFDPVIDFEPVAKLAEASYVLAVNPSIPATNMQSLITYLHKNPGKTSYATPGKGTPQHLAMELLKSQAGVDVLDVPYKGISGALTDLMGGQVQMMFATVHSVQPFVQAGKLRLLAVTGESRNPLAPNVPTFHEQGIDVMDRVDAWYAVLAPARTDSRLVDRLNADLVSVINAEDVRSELTRLGLSVQTGSPAQLSALIKSDLARWKKVVTDARIPAE